MSKLVEVQGISKLYGSRIALRDISFDADQGHVIALLGKNGAGKSTLMNIMTGYLSATEGTVRIDGYDTLRDPMAARQKIGYLPEMPPLYPDMTVAEYLVYCAKLKKIERRDISRETDRVIERTGLTEYRNRLASHLSKGYRQRAGLAQAMLGHRPLLILDEPGSGLDPVQMIQMRDLIRDLGRESTVLLSSHILSEVTGICDRAVVLDNGRLLYDGAMSDLLREKGSLIVSVRAGNAFEIRVRELSGVKAVNAEIRNDVLRLRLQGENGCDIRPDILRLCEDENAQLLELTPERETLEDAFLRLTAEREAET